MKGYEHLTETIEAYVTNQLSANEKQAFEALMENDAELGKMVEAERLLSDLVLEHDLLSLREKISEGIQKEEIKVKTKWWIAGTLVLATIVGIFLVTETNKNTEVKESVSVVVEAVQDSAKREFPNHKSEEKIETVTDKVVKKLNEKKFILSSSEEVKTEEKVQLNEPISTKIVSVENQEIVKKKEVIRDTARPVKCLFENVEAKIIATKSENGLSNGKIQVQLQASVADKLTFSLNQNQSFVKETVFSGLDKGKYLVFSRDLLGCEYELGQGIVTETNCKAEYSKTFSPEIEGSWSVPVIQGEHVSVEIKNKTGQNVYYFSGRVGEELLWTGETAGGGGVAVGLYKVFVSHPNGEVCVYSVTMFR